MDALWGVIIGGVLTITGQGAAELIRARVAGKGRVESRLRMRHKFRLESLELLESTALALHDVLIEYQSVNEPDSLLEKSFLEATSRFDAAVPRVESEEVRQKMNAWRNIAIRWVIDDDTAAAEQWAWQHALIACGESMRAAL